MLGLIMLLAVNVSFAQKGNKKGKKFEAKVQKQTDRLATAVGLSPAQTKQAHAINLKFAKKEKAIRKSFKGQKGNKQAKQAKLKPVREARDGEIKALMNADQQKKYAAFKKQKRKGKKGKKGKKARK